MWGLCLKLCLKGYNSQSVLKKMCKGSDSDLHEIELLQASDCWKWHEVFKFSRGYPPPPEPPQHDSHLWRSHHPTTQQIPHFQIKHGGPPSTYNKSWLRHCIPLTKYKWGHLTMGYVRDNLICILIDRVIDTKVTSNSIQISIHVHLYCTICCLCIICTYMYPTAQS